MYYCSARVLLLISPAHKQEINEISVSNGRLHVQESGNYKCTCINDWNSILAIVFDITWGSCSIMTWAMSHHHPHKHSIELWPIYVSLLGTAQLVHQVYCQSYHTESLDSAWSSLMARLFQVKLVIQTDKGLSAKRTTSLQRILLWVPVQWKQYILTSEKTTASL